MRVFAILLSLVLASACATGKPSSDQAELVTRIGVITGKDVVEPEEGGSDSRISTGVSASMSSDTGLFIGFGVLLSPLFGAASESVTARYHVKLQNGEQETVLYDSDLFQVGDCVEISSPAAGGKNPPRMKRVEGGC